MTAMIDGPGAGIPHRDRADGGQPQSVRDVRRGGPGHRDGGPGRTGAWQAVLIFTALSASRSRSRSWPTSLPASELDAPLDRVKVWMERNHSALVAGILLVIGAAVLQGGIHAL